jgi:hypothetical protein
MGWYVIGGLAALTVAMWAYGQFLRWVWAPVRSKGRTFSLVRAQRTPVADTDLTPEQRDVLGRLTAAFAGAGFERPATFGAGASVANATGLQRLLVHPATGDVAVIVIAQAKNIRNVVFAVRSDFADGRRISTGVNRSVTLIPPNPADDAVSFPWVRDVPPVLEAHRRRLDRAGRASDPRVRVDPEHVDVYLDDNWDREHAWHVRCGYRYLDAAAGKYRATWKGAFLSVWKLTPPVVGWRARRRGRRSRRLWRHLGMDAWQEPTVAPAAALPLPPDETVLEPDRSPLRYQSAIQAGELRQQRVGDTLVVRLGTPTAGQVLLRQWAGLLSAAVFAGLLCFTLASAWLQWRRWGAFPPNVRYQLLGGTIRYHALFAPLWAGLLTLDIWRVARAVGGTRGTVTVVASPAGLQFENLPGRRRAGHLTRDDIGGLGVALDRVGLTGRRYRLYVRPADAGDRRLTLFRARSAPLLHDVRRSIVNALGMSVDAPGATAATGV